MGTVRIFGHYLQRRALLLAIGEFLIVALVVYGVADRYGHHTGAGLLMRALVVASVATACMVALGLYDRHLRMQRARLAMRLAASLAAAAVLLAVLFYLVPGLYLGDRALGVSAVIVFLLLMLVHAVVYRNFEQWAAGRRVLIYGAGRTAASMLTRLRRRSDWVALNLVGCMPAPGEAVCVDAAHRLEPVEDLAAFARREGVDEVVVAMDDRRRGFPVEAFLACRLNGIAVSDLLAFYERNAGKIKTDLLHPSYIIFSEDNFGGRWRWRLLKRVLDFTAAGVLLSVIWPIMLLAMLAIKCEEGWHAPVLYRQRRIGQFGRPYTIVKFRSMRHDPLSTKVCWAAKDDDRITRVGRVLRRYRIDELPQLFNVLRGDMSFVGPRPEQPEIVQTLRRDLAFYDLRHHAKPGITGWAQISYPYGASLEDALEKLQFDLYYVKNSSLFLDLMVAIRTVEVVLFRKGAR